MENASKILMTLFKFDYKTFKFDQLIYSTM